MKKYAGGYFYENKMERLFCFDFLYRFLGFFF